MVDTKTVIMAHAEPAAEDAFNRHLPFWRRHSSDISVMCPLDSQVKTGLPIMPIGTRGHNGPEANRRFKKLLEILTMMDYDRYVIFEYDSLCLSPDLPQRVSEPGLWCNLFDEDQPTARGFKGSHFTHPPLVMDKGTLRDIVRRGEQVSDEAERGFWDRWLGLVCELGSIPMRGYGRLGFSKNTITESELPEAVKAVHGGAVMVHGVKSENVLNKLYAACYPILPS